MSTRETRNKIEMQDKQRHDSINVTLTSDHASSNPSTSHQEQAPA
jgi:hypothetical protein